MDSDSDAPTAVMGNDPTRAEPGAGTRPDSMGATHDLALGERVGRYTILDRVGAGGMGVVYAAYDPQLDRRVALKLLHAAGGSTHAGEEHARLLREAQALARVAHGNIVEVHDVGTVDDRVYVAMEFVRGETLRQWYARGPHPWQEVVEVLAHAGEGLAAAHAAGLVHRDFKPGNVMLGEDGRVLVLDFGLARMGDEEQQRAPKSVGEGPVATTDRLTAAITEAGTVLGTPAYMAPEQHTGGRVDGRADQFAFCVALWEGIHGERPFAGGSVDDLVSAVMRNEVRAPARRLPGWLNRALLRGLSREPGARHPSMRELLDILLHTPARRRRWTMFGAAATVLAVSVGGSYGVAQYRQATVCAGPAEAVESIWNEGRRGQVLEALRSDPRSWAAAGAEPVVQRLDAHAGSLAAAGHEACADTELRGEQSVAARQRREACLAGHREHLRVLVERLSAADPRQVLHAGAAAWSLPEPALCRGLRSDLPPSGAPDLAAARVDLWLGDAQGALRSLAAASRGGGDGPDAPGPTVDLLRLELMQALGSCCESTDDLLPLQRDAEALGLDRVSAWAWLHRLAWFPPDPQVAELAAAAVDRAGAPPDMMLALAQARARLALASGDVDAAVALHREALAGAEALHGSGSLQAAREHRALGELERRRGRIEQAVSRHLRAVALAQEVLGPDHPHTAPFMESLGAAMQEQGQSEEGRAYERRARRIRGVEGEGEP